MFSLALALIEKFIDCYRGYIHKKIADGNKVTIELLGEEFGD